MKAYLYAMYLGLSGILWNFASDAMIAAPIWFIWNYFSEIEYLKVFAGFYILGVVARTHFHFLKPIQPLLVYRIETLNGHQYMFASDIGAFKKDAGIQEAMRKAATRKRDINAVDR